MTIFRNKLDKEDVSAYRTKDYLLRLTAEENSELTKACLKYIRSIEGYTPKTREECEADLIEETADVLICIDLLMDSGLINETAVKNVYNQKYDRVVKRFKTGVYTS